MITNLVITLITSLLFFHKLPPYIISYLLSLPPCLSLFLSLSISHFPTGGLSLVLGGALMRSAQFGVYDSVLSILRKNHESSNVLPVKRILGVFDPHIIIAGFAGTLMPVHFIFSVALHQSSFHCSPIVSACLPFFFFCVSSPLNSFYPVSLLYLTSSLVCYLLFTAFINLL